MKRAIPWFLVVMIVTMAALTACSTETAKKEINIGYFPNISHAPAMIGVEKGLFDEKLEGYSVKTSTFPNGSLFMDALTTGQLDIGYVGPGPAINRFLQGGEVVVIANTSKGENVLIARKDSGIKSIQDLKGKIVATPSTGCTHDLIFRKMLQENGLELEENGGDVKRITQKPATMIGLIEQKQIDAAVVSEPWASLIQSKTGAEVIVEWDQVPWKGDLPSTVLVARKAFLEENPEAVEAFLEVHKQAVQAVQDNQDEAVQIISKQIKEITGEEIEENTIRNSLGRIQFTPILNKDIMQQFADLSKELGFIDGSSDLSQLFWEKLNK